jgi:hypothetical protein
MHTYAQASASRGRLRPGCRAVGCHG